MATSEPEDLARERRRKEARAATVLGGGERLQLLRVRQGDVEALNPTRWSRLPRLPETVSDPIPDLYGDFDLVFPVLELDAHTTGEDASWVFLRMGFPRELRPKGWVYLKFEGRIRARCRVEHMGFRESALEHTPDAYGKRIARPEATLELIGGWQYGNAPAYRRVGYR